MFIDNVKTTNILIIKTNGVNYKYLLAITGFAPYISKTPT